MVATDTEQLTGFIEPVPLLMRGGAKIHGGFTHTQTRVPTQAYMARGLVARTRVPCLRDCEVARIRRTHRIAASKKCRGELVEKIPRYFFGAGGAGAGA